MLNDIHYGLKSLLRAPAFTTASLLTLALGIAATAAILSVSYAILLKPLPYPDSHRLFVLGVQGEPSSLTGDFFHYVRDRLRTFDHVATHGGDVGWNLVSGRHTEHVNGMLVSQRYFDVIGVRPSAGRVFSETEDVWKGPPAVILNHALALRLFGDQSKAVGQQVQLSGHPYTVVGVMPASYWQTPAVDLWTPLQVSQRDNTIRETVRQILPNLPLTNVSTQAARIEGRFAQERLLAQAYAAFGALALTIASIGLFGLMSYSVTRRTKEIGIRLAVGAPRKDVLWLVLRDSLMLVVIGVVLGIAGVIAARDLVSSVLYGVTATDGLAVAMAIGMMVGVSAVAGYLPARRASRVNPLDALRYE